MAGIDEENPRNNPSNADYDEKFNSVKKAEETAGSASVADDRQGDADSVREAEDKGTALSGGLYKPSPEGKRLKFSVRTFLSKRGPMVGIVGGLGVAGALLAGIFGPSTMLVNLMENLTLMNDSNSTALERRFMKIFGHMTQPSDPICANNTKKLKCKTGRISNKALLQLSERAGITPFFDSSTRNTDITKGGYPSKNPTGYTVDLGDGKTANVAAKDLPGFLANNPKIAANVLGRKGAFNLRVKAWTGKYINQKLFGRINVNRGGGLSDGENGKHPASQIVSKATERLREKIPAIDRLGNLTTTLSNGIKTKVEGNLGPAKKGGTAYILAVAGCIGAKAPAYIAAGIAAVQLAQLLPVAHEVILSPGSKLKASGVDEGVEITPEDIEAPATLLTNQTPRASDGKMTSALDSPYLLSAMGVNTSKPPALADYAPGLAALVAIKPALAVERETRQACSAILSPGAMYSAMAVDAAVTVASSATVIGGIVKVIASFAIAEGVVFMLSDLISGGAKAAITAIGTNDKIPKAEGEELGHVLGISAAGFFSSGSMSRHVPGLKMSQLSDASVVQAENEAFRRDMDIASLSPFDTSSRYTFLGSIVHKFSTLALQNGTFSGGFLSQLFNLGRLPLTTLSVTAGATSNFTAEYCGYAEEFGLDTPDPADVPAINMAGLPCTGLTSNQAAMSTSFAIDAIESQGWINEDIETPESATIEDLLDSGYIKTETPLYDTITNCSDALSGDYLYNAAGCTTNNSTKDIAAVSHKLNVKSCGDLCVDDLEMGSGSVSAVALEAAPVALIDFQLAQMINGEDEEVGVASGEYVSPVSQGFQLRNGFGPRAAVSGASGASTWHTGQDIGAPPSDKSIYAIADGVVQSVGGDSTNPVRIKHADGLVSVYLHMWPGDVLVKSGDAVTAGQKIGKEGCSGQAQGYCSGDHLHIEIDISGVKSASKSLYESFKSNPVGTNRPPHSRIDPLEFFREMGVEGY